MTNTIIHKRSAVAGGVPTAAQLTPGELALNTADGVIYTEDTSGVIVPFTRGEGKNRIINGDFRIAQRGLSVAVAANSSAYTLDRWLVFATGAAATVNLGTQTTYPYSYLSSVGATGQTLLSIRQRIERANMRDLAGKMVTLSFYFYATAGSYAKAVKINRPTSGNNDFSATTNIASISLGTGNVFTRQQVQVTLPAEAHLGLEVAFEITNFNSASNTLVLFDVQLEEGPVATEFERRSVLLAYLDCKRYFNRVLLAGNRNVSGHANSVTISYDLPVQMYAIPTVTNPYITDANFTSGTVGATQFALYIPGVLNCTKTGTITPTVSANATAATIMLAGMTLNAIPTTLGGGADIYMDLSAEL